MFKRAYLSVKRKKTKTIIMFLFLFIVSTLVLCSISIKNATDKSMELAKESLGGKVTLSMNMSKLRDEFTPKNDENGIKEQMQDMHQKMSESNIKMSDVTSISSIKYVNDIKYTFNINALEKSFSLYETTNNDENNRGPKRESRLEIEAINAFDLNDDYNNNKIELANGESFNEEDNDVAIISYELAAENNLAVSDFITVIDSNNNEHTLKIKGIYQYKEKMGFINYNKIYIDINSAEKFLTDEEYNDGNYNISSAVFYLNSPDKVEEFKEEANKLVTDLNDRNLTLDIDTNSYDRMTSSINGVKTFSNIVLIVVIISSIVIMSLIIINSLKERNYEIGVLLSLGEKKLRIIVQFILELIMIGLVSFILAIGTSKLISQKFADVILDSQTSIMENQSENKRGNGFRGDTKFVNSNLNVIDELNVDVDIKSILLLSVAEITIIIVSMIVPAIKILNSDPKDILSRKE